MSLYRKTLLLARKVRNRVAPDDSFSKIDTDVSDVEEASKRIYDGIVGGKPFMVARYGSTELATVVNYLGVKNGIKNPFCFVFLDAGPMEREKCFLTFMARSLFI